MQNRSYALIVWALIALGTSASPNVAKHHRASNDRNRNVTCFIIRTFWGQGNKHGDGSLELLIQSLQNQTVDRWEGLLVVLDKIPFQDLRSIIKSTNDTRLWVHAEWIGSKYAPTEGLSWAPSYHEKLYNLTDEAIRACPINTDMVVVTNGDNEYDRHFIEEVEKAAAEGVDIFGVDYYSRYVRPTAAPCERFNWGPGVPLCKENEMKVCETDLGANAYRWQRLISENRRFGALRGEGTGPDNDGILTSILIKDGWKAKRLAGRCLLHHYPNPQLCAMEGEDMVWDDTIMFADEAHGGVCVPFSSIERKLRSRPTQLELIWVNLTFDPNSFDSAEHSELKLKCMRMSEPHRWRNEKVFGRACASRIDYDKLPIDLPGHPWDDRDKKLPESLEYTSKASDKSEL